MTARVTGFEWVDALVDKIRTKHGVEPEDVESALLNSDPPPLIGKAEAGKYRAWAQVEENGDYLFIVFSTPRPNTARVISARPMTSREKSKYRQAYWSVIV